MTEEKITLSEASKNLGDQVRKMFEAAKQWVRSFVESSRNWFKAHVKPVIQFVRDYEKNVARHKHNRHTRSTWRVDWNTRKGNQWMNHKPVFAVRKILR